MGLRPLQEPEHDQQTISPTAARVPSLLSRRNLLSNMFTAPRTGRPQRSDAIASQSLPDASVSLRPDQIDSRSSVRIAVQANSYACVFVYYGGLELRAPRGSQSLERLDDVFESSSTICAAAVRVVLRVAELSVADIATRSRAFARKVTQHASESRTAARRATLSRDS